MIKKTNRKLNIKLRSNSKETNTIVRTVLILAAIIASCAFYSSCAVVTAPVEAAGEVVKTGVKVVTYPVRKAVE